MDSLLYKKTYGCLCGGLIGDAMGAPAEDMHYKAIEEKFGWIDHFEGAGTDDSAIKQILCQAILDNDGYITADEWAKSFLANKALYPLFFIPVKNMFHKLESGLSLPVYAGVGNMHSSSSAMAISPMGIINACNPRAAALETYDVAGLLHAGDSTFCRDGACAMAAAVAQAMQADTSVERVVDAAGNYLHQTSSAEFLRSLSKVLSIARETGEYKSFRTRFYEECLGDIVSDSRETVPCALALFLLARGNAAQAIPYSANFGRDADTIGTMVGSLCGAFGGIDAFPVDWIEKLEASYGTRQSISKEEYTLSAVEMADQRALAHALEKVVIRRARDTEEVLSLLHELEAQHR